MNAANIARFKAQLEKGAQDKIANLKSESK